MKSHLFGLAAVAAAMTLAAPAFAHPASGAPMGPPASVTMGPPPSVPHGPPADVPHGPPADVPHGPSANVTNGSPSSASDHVSDSASLALPIFRNKPNFTHSQAVRLAPRGGSGWPFSLRQNATSNPIGSNIRRLR